MRYISKKFLSADLEESGSMVVSASTPKGTDYDAYTAHNPRVNAKVVFRACYGEPCELDFGFQTDGGLAKRLAKLDLMIEELQSLKEQLTPMWEEHKVTAEQYKQDHPDEKPRFLRLDELTDEDDEK